MGLATDTSQTFAATLPTDRDKPPEARPEFLFHHLSARETRSMMSLADRYEAAAGHPEQADAMALIDEMEKAVRGPLASWRRVIGRDGKDIAFDPERLMDVVTLEELPELLWAVIGGTQPTATDLGNSASPSPSGTAGSAGAPAPSDAAGAAAKTV